MVPPSSPRAPDGAPGRSGPTRPTADASRGRSALLVAGVVLVALVLRLPTAGDQSLWADESFTKRIVDGSLGHAWSTIGETENTPPLFYLLEWLWTRVTGTGELGLRSLSAVAGALAVVPTVALARRVGGAGAKSPADAPGDAERGRGARARARAVLADGVRRPPGAAQVPRGVPLAAGLLLAVNPLAQWFGQEARSYALFVLLAAVAWAALLRAAEEPAPRRVALWAVASVAVAWTHYFGGLLFVVGWGLLVAVVVAGAPGGTRLGALRPLALPLGTSGAAVAALLPIAADQQSTDMYRSISLVKGLGARIVETPKQFALGYDAPAEIVVGGLLAVVLVVLVLAGAWPRGGRATRGTLLLALVVAIWCLPLLALAVGFDVVLTRNLVLLIPPLAVLAALGAHRLGRRGLVVLGAVGVVQLGAVVAVAVTPVYQREDWRGFLRSAADGGPVPQLLVVQDFQRSAATTYAPDLVDVPPGAGATVQSIAVVDRPEQGTSLDPVPEPAPLPGFVLHRTDQRDQWRVFLWRAASPTPVAPELIESLRAGGARFAVVRR